MGFSRAAQQLTRDLSPGATKEFTSLVTTVAGQYSYSDSAMLKAMKSRLARAAKQRKPWAVEVLDLLSKKAQKA